jgi:hypothetical protein
MACECAKHGTVATKAELSDHEQRQDGPRFRTSAVVRSRDIDTLVSGHNSLGTVDSETATVRVFPANAAKLDLRMISGLSGLTIGGLP